MKLIEEKVIDYINKLIDENKIMGDDIEELQNDISEINKRLNELTTTDIEKAVEKFLATMIFVEITNSGYFIYYIPESWKDIKFNTTDLDIQVEGYDYGHLVLSY